MAIVKSKTRLGPKKPRRKVVADASSVKAAADRAAARASGGEVEAVSRVPVDPVIIKTVAEIADPVIKNLMATHALDQLNPPKPRGRPLDLVAGEPVGNLGMNFRIAPLSKWADTPLYAEACRKATAAFSKATPRPSFSSQTVLVQEYPKEDRIVFLFACWGRQMGMRDWAWLYLPVAMKLSAPLKAHLILTGRWTTKDTVH